MINGSTAHIESQSRERPACVSWCWLGRLENGKSDVAIGKGGVVCGRGRRKCRMNPTKLKDGLQIANRQRGAWVGASTWRA
jgi:hypothetical protein